MANSRHSTVLCSLRPSQAKHVTAPCGSPRPLHLLLLGGRQLLLVLAPPLDEPAGQEGVPGHSEFNWQPIQLLPALFVARHSWQRA